MVVAKKQLYDIVSGGTVIDTCCAESAEEAMEHWRNKREIIIDSHALIMYDKRSGGFYATLSYPDNPIQEKDWIWD